MDERHATILRTSRTEIGRLQLLSVFFEEEALYKIYLRSQVIHQLFENNEELDIDKLEIFHIQFTATLIELLKKIKKSNEKNVSLIYDEIQLNKELIDKMSSQVHSEKDFNLDKQQQSLKVNQSLRRLFKVLSDHSEEFPFSKNINAFSSRYANDFYYDISSGQLGSIIDYDPKNVYVDTHATIEKKLMGQLNKYGFKTEFFYGLKSGQLIVEVYKFMDMDKYFLFFPSRNLFLFCDLVKLSGVDFSNNLSEKAKIIQELSYKNDTLESSAAALKTYIPNEIIDLLKENYTKISDINFLDHLNNFDVQANILKAMLKTDLF
ncbi:hypothetical protein [Pedobacter metabolipauper]|uniref:Uncharacterized protein n=1 Tax=Pedobacter metabolipauper TaxID=425513 RepID=A0A4V3D1Q3_9SPHI|nr:hypothetical protein [Pedobacter metabolipauper]TDQ12043.1 hypothetical protein ATK78_1174 [Pedobacter metabolipauper]